VGNAISSARLKNGEWSVSRVIRSRQGRAACMRRWAGRVMTLSAVHSTYMRGTLPNRVAVVWTGVASGANGSDESNDYASTTSSQRYGLLVFGEDRCGRDDEGLGILGGGIPPRLWPTSTMGSGTDWASAVIWSVQLSSVTAPGTSM
jgi:hypothetical protein